MKKLIELDAAVSALDGLPMDYGRWDVDDVLHALTSVPPVDAVPVRHGRWIYRDDDEIQYDTYWCFECGNTVTVDATRRDDIGFTIDDLQYCPHCGAKMDGEDSEQHGR